MFNVTDDFSITITRGDSGDLEIRFAGDAPGENDIVVASAKKSLGSAQTIFRKLLLLSEEIENAFILRITTEDTQTLDFGRYVWDLRIIYADGYVLTPFANRPFVVSEVVTDITVPGGG